MASTSYGFTGRPFKVYFLLKCRGKWNSCPLSSHFMYSSYFVIILCPNNFVLKIRKIFDCLLNWFSTPYLINEMTWTIFPGLSFYPVGEVPHLWYISKILYIGTTYLWWLRYNKVIMNLYIYLSLFLFLKIAQSDVLDYYHGVMEILWSFHTLWGSKRI